MVYQSPDGSCPDEIHRSRICPPLCSHKRKQDHDYRSKRYRSCHHDGLSHGLTGCIRQKKSPKTIQNALSTTVHSFTKDRDYEVVISADFLTPNDNVLFVDDFLAYGNAALGILDLIEQSGAKLVGMGFIIEKAFQNGRKILEEKGVRVESLAIIEDLSNCCIKIKDQ